MIFTRIADNVKARQTESITELLLTPFGYPHPYNLNYVAQYRFVHQVGEFLVRRDNHQQFTGGLAHSWTISDDRKTITFHLRPGLYTASEVAQSLRRLIRAGQTSHANLAAQTSHDRIRAIDELNLEIRVNGDAGALLSPLVMADAAILPDDHWIKLPWSQDLQVDWKKTKGPYVYESGELPLTEGQSLVFKPNQAHYFFQSGQLNWQLTYQPLTGIKNLVHLKQLMEKGPSFTTIRYWDLIRIFATPDPGLTFYETRPNGIAYILLNLNSKIFSKDSARKFFYRRFLESNPPVMNEKHRADQIAQPGLSGRIPDDRLQKIIKSITAEPEFKFVQPLRWALPKSDEFNPAVITSLAEKMGLPFVAEDGPTYSDDPHWKKGEFDVMIESIGMSDTDPISGASFLFSPSGVGADLPDGRIMTILNSAKNTTDRGAVVQAIRDAFAAAQENALVIPLSYVVNRHYYSGKVALNIQDPFAESVRIWEVRIAR